MSRNAPYTRLGKTLDYYHSKLNRSLQAEMRTWLDEKNLRHSCRILNSVQEVKTIWKTNESIRIDSFYYPSKVKKLLSLDEKRIDPIEVEKYSDFGVDKGILIEGIVGHGKSILLRHLHNYELNKGKTLPLFIELRNVPSEESLESYLITYLTESLNLRCSQGLFNALLKENAISFFFDGFDEIPFRNRADFVIAIEALYKKSSNPIFFVTSRLNVELGKAPSFNVFRMVDLEAEDQPKFIAKLLKTKEEYEPLIKNLNEGAMKVRGLLNTPLILTLFALVYKHKITIPDSYSAFYKQLFDALISSHDGLKLGFARPTKSNLSAEEIKQILEYISLTIRQTEEFDFEESSFRRVCKEGLRRANIDIDLTARVIEDLVGVTCLVQKEGDKYRFLHENILYFFSASCIKNNADDGQAEQFYTNRLNKGWEKWINELEFLSNIDERRFNKYYYIPAIKRLFSRKYFPHKLLFTDESSMRIAASYKIVLSDHIKNKKGSGPEVRLFMGAPSCWVIPKMFTDIRGGSEKVYLTDHIIRGLIKYLVEDNERVKSLERVLRKVGVKAVQGEVMKYVTGLDVIISTLSMQKEFSASLNKADLTSIYKLYSGLVSRTNSYDSDRDIFV